MPVLSMFSLSVRFHWLLSEGVKNGPLVNLFSVVKVYKFKLNLANFFFGLSTPLESKLHESRNCIPLMAVFPTSGTMTGT